MDYSTFEKKLTPLIENQAALNVCPIDLSIVEITHYPIHMHPALELIYVLQGKLRLRSSIDQTSLSQGDFYIINSSDLHEINGGTEGALVFFMHIDLEKYLEYEPNLNSIIFASESSEENALLAVKNQLTAIYQEKSSCSKYSERLNSLTVKLLLNLTNHFQFFCRYDNTLGNTSDFKDKKPFHMQRVHRIIDYIYDNFDQKLTLDHLAQQEYISKYYLTHILKHAVGHSFQETLTLVRVEESEKLLLATSKSVEEIAYLCGFSSPSYYSRSFKSFFKDTPSSYREKHLPDIISSKPPQLRLLGEKESSEKMGQLFPMAEANSACSPLHPLPCIIDQDFSHKASPKSGLPKVVLHLKDMRPFFTGQLLGQLSDLLEQISLYGVFVDSKSSFEIYQLFGSWSWFDGFFNLMEGMKLKVIFDEAMKDASNPSWPASHFGSLSSVSYDCDFIHCYDPAIPLALLEAGGEEYLCLEPALFYEGTMHSRSFYRVSLLTSLGPQILRQCENFLIARGDSGYQFLICNHQKAAREFIIKLSGIQKHYSILQYILDSSQPSETELYQRAGAPAMLTERLLTAIKKQASPAVELTAIGETYFHDLYLVLPPSGIALIVAQADDEVCCKISVRG